MHSSVILIAIVSGCNSKCVQPKLIMMLKVAGENLELEYLTLEKKINALDTLGKLILSNLDEFGEAIFQSSLHNKWFDIDHLHYALRTIAQHFLNKELLLNWVKAYNIQQH